MSHFIVARITLLKPQIPSNVNFPKKFQHMNSTPHSPHKPCALNLTIRNKVHLSRFKKPIDIQNIEMWNFCSWQVPRQNWITHGGRLHHHKSIIMPLKYEYFFNASNVHFFHYAASPNLQTVFFLHSLPPMTLHRNRLLVSTSGLRLSSSQTPSYSFGCGAGWLPKPFHHSTRENDIFLPHFRHFLAITLSRNWKWS